MKTKKRPVRSLSVAIVRPLRRIVPKNKAMKIALSRLEKTYNAGFIQNFRVLPNTGSQTQPATTNQL